jgi:hypothetical protein
MRVSNVRISAMSGVSRSLSPGDAGWIRCRTSCRRPGCSWGGGPGSGEPCRSAWWYVGGMAGGDLDNSEVDAGVEHGREKRRCISVRVRLGDLDATGLGELAQAADCGVAVHPGAATIEQDRPVSPQADCPVDSPADCGRQRDQDDLGAFAAHAQHPMAVGALGPSR